MIVYLARDIPAFVMYCVNGESGSSLLIESTDSMIYNEQVIYTCVYKEQVIYTCVYNEQVIYTCVYNEQVIYIII